MKISASVIQPVRHMSILLDSFARTTYAFFARGVRQIFRFAQSSCKIPWLS